MGKGKELAEKSFCKWEKEDIRRNIDQIYAMTADPHYVCEKCARVAREKMNLCKPYGFDRSGEIVL